MFKIFFTLTILLIFSGCTVVESPYYFSTKATDFKTPTERLILKMNDKLLSIGPRVISKYIYVVDFVNVKDLNVTSKLGPSLSLEIKSHISCIYGYTIKEIEYMNYFKITEKGLKLSSRNTNDILKEADKTYALVGTYTLTEQQLILFLKLIDMNTGNILATSSESIKVTEEIANMEKESRAVLRPHMVL